MISLMRKIAPIVMWVVLVAFIGTIFFAWGMDFTQRENVGTYIGTIDTKKIPVRSFFSLVERERERMRMNSETEIPEQQNRMIPRQVWDREVSRYLYDEIFSQMNLTGTSDEVFEYLKKNPPPEIMNHQQFQTDSVFDTSKFVRFLNTPESYDNPGMLELEAQIKNYIVPMLKLKSLAEAGVIPSKLEIAGEYRDRYEKAVIEFAKVSPSAFQVNPADITDAMIEKYYKDRPDSFTTTEQAELYFIKIPKLPTDADQKLYYSELVEIKDRVLKGETTFEEEAKAESDDEASAVKGGELGWVSRGQMVPQFELAAFTQASGTISDPVKTTYGYHLVFVEEQEMKKDTVMRVKLKHILRKVIPSGETIDSLESMADSLRKVALEKGLKEAVKGRTDIFVDSTGLFKKGDMVRGIGALTGMFNYVFPQSGDFEVKDKISERLTSDRAIFFISIKKKNKKGLQPLTDVNPRVAEMLRDSLQTQKAREYIESVRTKLETQPNLQLETLKGKDSLVVYGKTDTITRRQYVPDVGYDNGAVAVAFSLPIGTLSKPVYADKSLYIVKPVWKKMTDTIPWESYEMQQVKQALIEKAQQNAFMEYYISFRNSKKIVDYLDKYFE